MRWTEDEIFVIKNIYPEKGLLFCAELLGRTSGQVRGKASKLGIKQDKDSEFFKEWQKRAAESKVGKKRPEQALVMKNNHTTGKMIQTSEQRLTGSIKIKNWHANNEHPKGHLGKKHSPETLSKMSESTKKMWENMSEEQKDKMAKASSENGRKINPINRDGASWKAGWREIGGSKKYYRSRWEANYARYLQFLQEKGEIQSWKHENKTFWFEGIKRGCMSYLPDFEVIEKNGEVVYHEVKGWMDERSKTKITRMAKYHPNVKLIVIDAKPYRSLEKTMSRMIKEWEK